MRPGDLELEDLEVLEVIATYIHLMISFISFIGTNYINHVKSIHMTLFIYTLSLSPGCRLPLEILVTIL